MKQIIITEILKNLSKKPDYIVKVESLYDDLMNLDFIKKTIENSVIKSSGLVNSMVF